MQLTGLLEKMKMDHLSSQLDALCEQAAKRDLGYREFLMEALQMEWNGRYQKGVEFRLRTTRFPWIKTVEQFDFSFRPSFVYPRLLIIDEMGYLPMSREEAGLFSASHETL